jgi:hypothetical protein
LPNGLRAGRRQRSGHPGGKGNDLISGDNGNDTIDGRAGNDRVFDHWRRVWC